MPGGKKDQGEDNLKALVREIKEELKLDIDPSSIDYYGLFEAQAYGKDEGVMVKIHCYMSDHKGNAESSMEIEEIAFFSHDEYLSRKEVAPAVRLIIKDLRTKGLIE
jgi:8-oxo-dGTP pyrophosphatase MutT (NUDIX family)